MKLLTTMASVSVALFAIVATASLANAAPQTTTLKPVIVELFTSEGCSDCPDADRLLAHLVKSQPYSGIKIVGLEEHIDYWNNSHWGDPFSSKLFTSRQYAYSDHFNDNSVYTPEMVVNGDEHFVGSDSESAASAIVKAAQGNSATVNINLSPSQNAETVTVTVGHLPSKFGSNCELFVGVTEDSILSHVADGENAGRTLAHGSVVRELVTAGSVNAGSSGQEFSVSLPIAAAWKTHPLSVVAFLQSPTNLRIYGSSEAAI